MSANRIQLLEQYLKEDPGDAFTMYALALEYLKLEKTNKASELFSTIVNNHPGYLPVYYHFGKLSEKLNDKEKANEIFLKGMELAQKLKDSHTLSELKQAYNSLNGLEDEFSE